MVLVLILFGGRGKCRVRVFGWLEIGDCGSLLFLFGEVLNKGFTLRGIES